VQRGILKHYAHVLPQIFAERILWSPQTDGRTPDGLVVLASWGAGHLTIDMIHGTCVRDHRSEESLWAAGELPGWLAHELRKQTDPPSDISATLEVDFTAELDQSKPIWAGRAGFDCMATIASGGRTFVDHYSTG
jgi:hypothetical protein